MMIKSQCKYFALIFFPIFAPNGEAIKLATIMITAGTNNTCPVMTLLVAVPMDDRNVIANEVAMVILVGILRITNMIGTNINAPPAPTIPAPIPTSNANIDANHRLRSEEHTSELQSRGHLVCRLLLENR